MSLIEVHRIQYRILQGLCSGLHSKLKDLHKQIENLEERLIPIAIGTQHGYQNTAVLSLATPLDSHRGGNDLSVVNQPHLPADIGKKEYKRKKKERRGLSGWNIRFLHCPEVANVGRWKVCIPTFIPNCKAFVNYISGLCKQFQYFINEDEIATRITGVIGRNFWLID